MKQTIDEQIEEFCAQIRAIEAKRAELLLEKQKFEALTDTQKLADLLHTKRCTANHTDGCGWCYESWAKPGYSRNMWWDKADEVLNRMTYDEAVKALKILG
jgi:hypothetical protein